MSIKEQLTQLLDKSVTSLSQIWDHVGFSPVEQEEQMKVFLGLVSELCAQRIQGEQALVATYEAEVVKLRRDIDISMDNMDLVRGEGELQKTMRSSGKYGDAPPTLIQELTQLRSDYDALEEKKRKIEALIGERRLRIVKLVEEMGTTLPEGLETNPKLTLKRQQELDEQVRVLEEERAARVAHVEEYASRAKELLELLEMDAAGGSSKPIPIDLTSIRRLESRVEELEKEREMREKILARLSCEIKQAYEGMRLSSDTFFAKQPPGKLGEATILTYERELAALQRQRKVRIGELIELAREELRGVLEEARPNVSERARVHRLLGESIPTEDYAGCERMLASCEAEIASQRQVAARLAPVVAICQRYLTLVKERGEYEVLVQDSSRLLQRGKRAGIPSLQEEEKMRRRVMDMPRFVLALKQVVQGYEKAHLPSGGYVELGDLFGEDTSVVIVVDRMEREHAERLVREKEQRVAAKLSKTAIGNGSVLAKSSGAMGGPLKPRNHVAV